MVSGEVIESRAPTVQEIAEFSSALSPDLAGFDPDIWQMSARTPERWVRIHSLPDSKRYADTPAETAEILRRHHLALSALIALGGEREPTPLIVMTCSYGPHDIALDTSWVLPHRAWWQVFYEDGRRVPDEEGLYHPIDAWLSIVDAEPSSLDPLLRRIADDEIARVLVLDRDARWAYHPYDGGGDILAPNEAARDALTARFSSWLSSHPSGM